MSAFLELDGIAKAQDQNQPVPFSVACLGALKKSVTSATLELFGFLTSLAAEVASTQVAHLPSLNKALFSL